MQSFFTKKYIKVPIVSLVVVSLLLQFIPAPKPANAFSMQDLLNKILGAIQIPPELELTSDGSIEFGTWLAKKHFSGSNSNESVFNCLFKKHEYEVIEVKDEEEHKKLRVRLEFCGCKIDGGLKCGWRDNNDCRAECTNDDGCEGKNACCLEDDASIDGFPLGEEKCVNPFSTFRFGIHESQTDLIIQTGPKKGSLAIPRPKTPPRCQLRIPLPDEDDTTTIEEKLAERKACNYFRSAQKAAAQVTYAAKKIFNNTDPLSKCFFLRNCKTACTFRFGEIGYTITLLDIIRLFVGDASVALDVVQKIINAVEIFRAILELGTAFADLFKEAVSFFGTLLDTVRNLATLGSSLREIGFKIRDVFIFTPKEIIEGQTQKRVSQAYNGFIDLISNFASNLEKYQVAKSETLALIEQTQEDVDHVMEDPVIVNLGSTDSPDKVNIAGFKNELEIGFLFVKKKDPDNPTNYENKRKLDKIVANYQSIFKPISSLVEQVASIGDMFDGQLFSDLTPGILEELYKQSVEKFKEMCCGEKYEEMCCNEDDQVGCEMKAMWAGHWACETTQYHNYTHPEETNNPTQAREELVQIMEKHMSEGIKTYFSPKRGTSVHFYGEPFIPWDPGLATQDIKLDEEWFEKFCKDNSCWYNDEGGEYCNVYSFKGDRVTAHNAEYSVVKGSDLLDSDHIRDVIYQSLSKGGDTRLSYRDDDWAEYWRELAYRCKDDEWVNKILKSGKSPEDQHDEIHKACTDYDDGVAREAWPGLQSIWSLDGNKNISKSITEYVWDDDLGGDKAITTTVPDDEYIEGKIQLYEGYRPRFRFDAEESEEGGEPWFQTFQEIFKEINDFRKIFKFLDPVYIKGVIKGALIGFNCSGEGDEFTCDDFGEERLDKSKGAWRLYWENFGILLFGKERIDSIIKKRRDPIKPDVEKGKLDTMEKRHKYIMKLVVGAISILEPISRLDNSVHKDKFKKEKGFRDSKIVTAFETFPISVIDPATGEAAIDPVTGEKIKYLGYIAAFKEYFEVSPGQIARIGRIKDSINALEQQDEALRESVDERPNDYWEGRLWCGKGGSLDTLSIGLEEQYVGTFDGAVVDYDWEKRISFIVDAKPILDVIKNAFEYKLSPSQPVLFVYISRAQEQLKKLGDLYQETIKELFCGKDLNCNVDATGADRGLLAERHAYCEDANARCRGEKKMGEYGTYCELDGYYQCYEDGSGSDCASVPSTPSCDSWIGACSTCSTCKSNCVANRSGTCEKVVDYDYYTCSVTGNTTYGTYNFCRNACEDKDPEDWDCDHHYDTDGKCHLSGDWKDHKIYSSVSSCNTNCKRSNTGSRAACETSYCSGNNEACGLRNTYKQKSTKELNRLNAECARRVRYTEYLGHYSGSELDLEDEFDINFEPINKAFEEQFEPLKKELGDLLYLWNKRVDVQRESAVASSTIHKITGTIDISKKIVDIILPPIDAALVDLDALDDVAAYLNDGYCEDPNNCGDDNANDKVSKKTWDKLLYKDEDDSDNSGVIVRFQAEVAAAKKQIVNAIKIKAGTYSNVRYPELDDDGNVKDTHTSGCPDEETGDLFLNRIKCFEVANKRMFEQLPDFIKVIEGLEDVGFAMDDLKDNVIDLEPSIDMEVVDGIGDKFEAIGDNPITLLDKTFEEIRDIFKDAEGFLDKAGAKLMHSNVFGTGKRADTDRMRSYQSATKNLQDENMTDLTGLVFREDDITKGCQALSMVLNSDPRATRERCKDRIEDLIGEDIDDFNDANSQKRCRALGELDLTLFVEDAEEQQEKAIAERDRLLRQRECVREIRCDTPALDSCITCPEWICEGIDDPYCCDEFDKDTNECLKRDDNYDGEYGVIWNTPQPKETDDVITSICQDAQLGNDCKVSDLEAQCELNKKFDINMFPESPEYYGPPVSSDPSLAQLNEDIPKLEKERACIAYERCEDGFDVNYFSDDIKTTVVNGVTQPCITCPKWICANDEGGILPPGSATNDPHCADPANGWEEGKNIIWDSWGVGVRIWPRETACFSDDEKTRAGVDADEYSRRMPSVPVMIANQEWMTSECVAKQKELKEKIAAAKILEEAGEEPEHIWNKGDGWPCKTFTDCEHLAEACQQLKDKNGSVVALPPGWKEWPPRDPCKKGKLDYANSMAKGYSGAQTICIDTQKNLALHRTMLGENDDPDDNFDWVTKDLIAQCDELAAQKSLKRECEHFEMLEKNVFPNKCGFLSGLDNCQCDCDDDDPTYSCKKYCESIQQGRIVAPCKDYCKVLNNRAWYSFCRVSDDAADNGIEAVLNCLDHVIPNLALPMPNNKLEENLTKKEKEDLNKLIDDRYNVIEKCATAAHNIEQPLDEIMKIFAILLGIKSATGLYGGVQILKSSTTKIIKDVKKFMVMIKGTPCENSAEYCDCGECKLNDDSGSGAKCSGGIVQDIQCLWKQIDEGLSGGDENKGLSVDALRCESHPAVSYSTTKGEKLTSNKGGPVCLGVSDLFQQIEGQFGIVRQNVRQIDLVRRGVKEGGFSIGRLKLHLWNTYPVLWTSFNDLYEDAESIRTRTSYVWALANALDFANKQCTCGESYCKMPLCISGLPFAFAPVTNPYCYIVWIFRYPMLKVADGLAKFLDPSLEEDSLAE